MKNSLRYVGGTNPTSDASLIDNIAPMIDRAMAIADLLQAVHSSDNTVVMDDTPALANWAIMLEMADARASLDAWRKAKTKKHARETKERAEAEKKRLEDPKERMRDSLHFILADEFPDPAERAAEIERRFAREEAKGHG